MTLADMMLRAHKGAVGILETIEHVTPGLIENVIELGLVINTLDAVETFSKSTSSDLKDAIFELKEVHPLIERWLEQVLTDFDIVTRGVAESKNLTKETRTKLEAATIVLKNGKDLLKEHRNLTSNIATVGTGLEYLYSDPVYLERILNIARPEVTAEILERMGWVVERPGPE